MNRWILQDRNVSIVKRLRHFRFVVSSVACPAGGHRIVHNRHFERLNTHFRKSGTEWTLEWHEILHQWNVRLNIFIDRNNIKTWSLICFLSYWRLASHIATLPPERWVRRILRPTFSLGVSHTPLQGSTAWNQIPQSTANMYPVLQVLRSTTQFYAVLQSIAPY